MAVETFDEMLESGALQHIKSLGAALHTYYVRGAAAGVSRYILIDRGSPQGYGGGLDAAGSVVDAWICNDSTNGVANVNKGGDRITLTPRLGETAKTYRVAEIIEQDAGLWHLRLDVNG